MLTLPEYSHISCNFSSLNLSFPAECVAILHNVNLNIIRDDFPLGIAVVTLPYGCDKTPSSQQFRQEKVFPACRLRRSLSIEVTGAGAGSQLVTGCTNSGSR